MSVFPASISSAPDLTQQPIDAYIGGQPVVGNIVAGFVSVGTRPWSLSSRRLDQTELGQRFQRIGPGAGTVVERAEPGHRTSADGDNDLLARFGPLKVVGQIGSQPAGADGQTAAPVEPITVCCRSHTETLDRRPSRCVLVCTRTGWPRQRGCPKVGDMNFAFSEEQEQLRQFVRSFLEDKSPETAVREQMETEKGFDEAVWSQMAEQLGLQSLVIPEEYGGQGYGFVELGVVLEEMGRVLVCAPFFSGVMATCALLQSGDDEAKKTHLPGIASGETFATVAFTEDSGKWDESGITMEASPADGGHTLSGTKSFVLDGHVANLILVAARSASGVSLFAVDGEASGLSRESLATMDQTRKQARLTFENTSATLIGTEGDGWNTLSTTLDLAAVALAAEQVGGAQFVLDMAVQYAKDRVQFGRPIGSFQAIKHKCADMLLEVESAKSAAYYALWCASEMNDELPSVASLAKAYCSEAYFHAAAENIQIHGGIGFTWEHPAHLYFKRAKSSELLFGDPAYHRELLAQRIGL